MSDFIPSGALRQVRKKKDDAIRKSIHLELVRMRMATASYYIPEEALEAFQQYYLAGPYFKDLQDEEAWGYEAYTGLHSDGEDMIFPQVRDIKGRLRGNMLPEGDSPVLDEQSEEG